MAATGYVNVHSHFNPEEAANVAMEYVASLDNLPGEVTFLLQEIAEKDNKIHSLTSRIHTRHHALTKNVKQLISQPSSGTSTPTASFPLPIPAGQPIPINHLSTKDQQAMQKIQSEWARVEQLQLDKIELAQRLETIISRARERGQAEWRKVGGMDLDEIEKQDGKTLFGELGGSEVLLPSGGLGSGSDGRPQKKKKPNALPLPMPQFMPQIVHPPTSMPPPPAPRPTLSARGSSRHHRQVSTSTLSEEADADGEAEAEEEGDPDNTLYCFCQKKSYGEMIGCDNDKCDFEWFHVTCVNMQDQPLPETWYCPVCVKALGFISSDGTRAGGQRGPKPKRR